MDLFLLFILSGAISWGLGALLLLAFVHALTRAMAASMQVSHGGRTAVGARSIGLAAWRSADERSQLAPAGELVQAGRQRGEGRQDERREQQEAPAA